MDMLQQAEKYVEGKVNQMITRAIAEVYVEIYNNAGNKGREHDSSQIYL